MEIAILGDYQNVVLKMADWSPLSERAEITVLSDHVADPSTLVERLLPFDLVCECGSRLHSHEVLQRLPATSVPLAANLVEREKVMIETALREAEGVIGVPPAPLPSWAFPGRRSNRRSRNWESTGTDSRPRNLSSLEDR
jgi:hypothetical protein